VGSGDGGSARAVSAFGSGMGAGGAAFTAATGSIRVPGGGTVGQSMIGSAV